MGTSRDHVVPQMYLRRFGKQQSSGYLVDALEVDDPGRRFTASTRGVAAEWDFHLALLADGTWDHSLEDTLSLVEQGAANALSHLLDRRTPDDDAFPWPWPCHPVLKMSLSLLLAAQVVRTVPQRERLSRLLTDQASTSLPDWALANAHLRYMTESVIPLALMLSQRAWAFGVSGECLLTSDNPAIIINGRPDEDPAKTAAFWDIYLPLDAHRFIFVPGLDHTDRPSLLQRDHRMLLDGGLALAMNLGMCDQAHRHVFWHPNHDPTGRLDLDEMQKMRVSWKSGHSDAVLTYDRLPDNMGVRMKDLYGHVRLPKKGSR